MIGIDARPSYRISALIRITRASRVDVLRPAGLPRSAGVEFIDENGGAPVSY